MGVIKFLDSHPSYKTYDSKNTFTDSLPIGFSSKLGALILKNVEGKEDLKPIVNHLYLEALEDPPKNWGWDYLSEDLSNIMRKWSKKKFEKFLDAFLTTVDKYLRDQAFVDEFNELAEEENFAYRIDRAWDVFGYYTYEWVLSSEEQNTMPVKTEPKIQQPKPQIQDTVKKVESRTRRPEPSSKVETNPAAESVDIAIVAALEEELSPLLKIEEFGWKDDYDGREATTYHKGTLKRGDRVINIVAARCTQMGMAAATLLTTNIIYKYRPKYLAMIGIAAGVRNNNSAFGDILVAEQSFDYGSGKIIAGMDGTRIFEPDFRKISVDSTLMGKLQRMKGSLQGISEKFNGDRPREYPQLIFGPLASGAMVVSHSQVVDEIKLHERKLIGIDMETYGVYYAASHCSEPRPKFFSAKAICDFADEQKSDQYHTYAAYISANFLHIFMKEQLF